MSQSHLRDHTVIAGGEPDPVWVATDSYFNAQLLTAHDDPYYHALGATYRRSISSGLADIAVSATQGKFLALQIKIAGANNVLEIGTLGGYSTIWMASAGPNIKVTSIDVDEHANKIANENIHQAGLGGRVELILGNALEVLPRIKAQVEDGKRPAFDFVFIDADKENNLEYFNYALEMAHQGSVIVIDNVVRRGKVVDEESIQNDDRVKGVRKVVEAAGKNDRVETTAIQTVGEKGYDGFLLAYVR